MATIAEWFLGVSVAPLLLAGISHLLRRTAPHSGVPHLIPSALLGATEITVAIVAIVRFDATSIAAVTILYSVFVAFLIAAHLRDADPAPCGCSVLFTSYVDRITIGRAALLGVASIASLAASTASGIGIPSGAFILGAVTGIVFFVSLEMLSHLRWVLRANTLQAAGGRGTASPTA